MSGNSIYKSQDKIHTRIKSSFTMEFTFQQSRSNNSRGTLYYRYFPLANAMGSKHDTKAIKSTANKQGTVNPGSTSVNVKVGKKSSRTRISLGIELSVEEWNAYHSGDYDPNAIMPSMDISYSKFEKFLQMVRKTVDNNRMDTNLKFIVQMEIMKLITQSK